MNWTVLVSAATAFVITGGGAMGVALVAAKGGVIDKTTWLATVVLGLISAGKDVRSLLKLPPVATGGDEPPTPAPRTTGPGAAGKTIVGLLLCFGLLCCVAPGSGCSSVNRSAYVATSTTTVGLGLAVNEWNLYVLQKHPGVVQELAVRNAVDKAKASMLLVCDAGAANAAAIHGTNSPLADAFSQIVADAARDQADAIALMTEFGLRLTQPK